MNNDPRFQGVTTRQLCYLLKDAKKFTADEYPEWRQEAAQQDVVAIEAECVRRDAELAQLRAELARLKPLKIAAQEYSVGWTPEFALHQAAREYAAMEYEYARAQAQAGEGA